MAFFKTTFYDYATGVEFSVTWPTERQYLSAKAFLDELTGGSVHRSDPEQPDFYILENEQQREAMLDFRKRMRVNR